MKIIEPHFAAPVAAHSGRVISLEKLAEPANFSAVITAKEDYIAIKRRKLISCAALSACYYLRKLAM
jgi:hypothetical protein